MPAAFGFLILFVGAFLIRQVAVGRALETPDDARDLLTSLFSGDYKGAKQIAAQRGTNVEGTATVPDSAVSGSLGSSNSPGAMALAEARKLGSAAKGYRYAGTGPDYYDCSGLVWRALKNLNIWNGPRFSSATWVFIAPGIADKVMSPEVGDIVVWPGEHIGIVSGPGEAYSALSTKYGIRDYPIKQTRSGTPEYWRLRNG